MNKAIYNKVAKQLNSKLPYGSVSVINTKDFDKYCDNWSLALDENALDMLYSQRDKTTINAFLDTIFEVDGNRYYIEPYTSRLHNLALL